MEFYYLKFSELIYHFTSKFVNEAPEFQYFLINANFSPSTQTLFTEIIRDFFVQFEDFGYSTDQLVEFFTKTSTAFLRSMHIHINYYNFFSFFCTFMNSSFAVYFNVTV